ncbi:MAG: hypothetical protein IV094_21020 [Vitreoscilla sp.]|nr:hypothetical protein [Vitreoscilla sp.]
MNPWLLGAAGLSVLIALAHSVIGEQRIFRHLRRAGQVVPTEGGTVLREFQVRILWGAWHGLSAMGLGLAAVLVWLAHPAAQAVSAGRVEWCVATAMAATGVLVLVSNRGRHPAWVALLGLAGLVLASR